MSDLLLWCARILFLLLIGTIYLTYDPIRFQTTIKKRKSYPTIYIIRHGEKPSTKDGKTPIGLGSKGKIRAQALVDIFGRKSKYDIGMIIAMKPKKNGKRARPFLTIKPLADSLMPDVLVDIKIDRADAKGVAKAIRRFDGPGNVLVCWAHKQIPKVARAIGAKHVPKFPGDRSDIIWTIEPPYHKISSVTSEHVPGLDDAYAGEPTYEKLEDC